MMILLHLTLHPLYVKIPLLPFLAKSYKQLIMLLIYPNQVTSLQEQMGKQALIEALLFQ